MEDAFAEARRLMLERDLKGRGITDLNVLRVMAEIPREEFVPKMCHSQAYCDGPLPIDMGQTISQPYIVALMTQELQLGPDCEVLELGTGSGYQTAVLARLAKRIYTIEKFEELSKSARGVLDRLGINNVEFRVGDGSCGWPRSQLPRCGCFDRIMITAAVPRMPEPLIEQLTDGGLIVGPVGGPAVQDLVVAKKRAGRLIQTTVCGCRFVRLVGKNAFEQ
ncbi:MAG: protein-L-isoaspartate(D-aspartate) O-methyltransferase [Phycisphaerales bacterium]|nr:MAG: protein-L-isoaspartate(D-aspartate) O-methyltransferase [Phycisphaerales bacterium]